MASRHHHALHSTETIRHLGLTHAYATIALICWEKYFRARANQRLMNNGQHSNENIVRPETSNTVGPGPSNTVGPEPSNTEFIDHIVEYLTSQLPEDACLFGMTNEERHSLLESRGLGSLLRSVALDHYRLTGVYRARVVDRVRRLYAEVEAEMTSSPGGQPATEAPRDTNPSCGCSCGKPPFPSCHNINTWALYMADHPVPLPLDRGKFVKESANLINAIPDLVRKRIS
ncbi:hypothetical protein NKR19_g2204 [Coniochaeta hoffmannii]|uniref:Uncharacterized protein n=1 Tax=Coniochaeta hoffmannii TaxID=91930 RepID=A0AA38S5V5_9PEZI|nr:hypothetical protein NKR19_g2204 [Coniochaeta hoffmannii]